MEKVLRAQGGKLMEKKANGLVDWWVIEALFPELPL